MTTNDSGPDGHEMDDCEMNDSGLDRRLDALTRFAEPGPANWTAIEARIRRRRHWPIVMPAGIAAAAVLSIVVLLVSLTGPTPAPSDGLADVMQAEARAMRVAASEMLVAPEFDDSPAALTTAWQENQRAISELEQGLLRNPTNRLLLEFLTEARMRQARLARLIGHEQTPTNERSMNL